LPVKPPFGVTVMVELALLPGVRILTEVPLRANVGETSGALTVAAMVVVAVTLPDVPVTVAVYKPGVVVVRVVIVMVAVAGSAPVIAEGWVVEHVGKSVAPAVLAATAQASVTLPVNPPVGVKVKVEVPLVPAAKAAISVALSAKVGSRGTVTVPDVAVTVAVYNPGLVFAEVPMVRAVVPVAPAASTTGCEAAQVGGLAAPDGLAVRAQERATVPENPLLDASATAAVADVPATMAAGGVALKEKVGAGWMT
jgi:hypothetical protein